MSTNEDKLYEGLGIQDFGPGMKEGRSYAVPFTLFGDAVSPHKAFERACSSGISSGRATPTMFGVSPSTGSFTTWRAAETNRLLP